MALRNVWATIEKDEKRVADSYATLPPHLVYRGS